ncbi:MAG: polyketide biosynthesis 3-hydroxy-3-methylglutaryl-CoA synthase-like enzyme PksG, partial [Myxococcota bacterium]
SASVYLALLGTIDQAPPDQPHRVGIFSYGSGCSSEFYSGVLPPQASTRLQSYGLDAAIAARYRLRFDEYESLLDQNARWGFGIRDQEVDLEPFASIYERNLQGRGFLVLKRVKGFHREYDWS